MSDQDDNVTLQSEELEALGSIYGDDFVLEDDAYPPTFTVSVPVTDFDGKKVKEASLMVTFETDYPGKAPPLFQLSIPWLRGEEKGKIVAELEQLYLDHIGESIVYLWVERLRELLEGNQQAAASHQSEGKEQSEEQGHKNSLAENLSTLDLSDPSVSCKSGSMRAECHGDPLPMNLNIFTGEPFTDRKSTFQAHVAGITEVSHVRMVVDELYKNKKIASATHNMYAYRIFNKSTSSFLQDCDDDGETHAGSRLLHLLQILDCRNVIVVVTRWYGGIQLHGDRFKHINNVARQALEQQGFIGNDGKPGKK